MPTFQIGTYDEVRATGIVEEHWSELPNYCEIALATQDDQYRRIEAEGKLAVYVAKDEGEAVAYAAFFLHEVMTSDGMLEAMNHALFMKPTLRGKGIGMQFMKFIEDDLRDKGVEKYTLQFKPHAVPDAFLAALGVEMTEVMFGKYIGE